MTYYFQTDDKTAKIGAIGIVGRFVSIPLDSANTDCAQFLADWKAGATVTNADGSPAPYSDDAVRTLGLTP